MIKSLNFLSLTIQNKHKCLLKEIYMKETPAKVQLVDN